MHNILKEIIEQKEYTIKKYKDFEVNRTKTLFAFQRMFKKNGRLKIIAEFKIASPSKGIINKNANFEKYINLYNLYADGISILTEEKYFLGDIKLINTAKKMATIPILAKDFYIHPIQIKRALFYGADAILLIIRLLSDTMLSMLYSLSERLGVDAICEVHSEEDIEKLFKTVTPKIVGINTRDLSTFKIHKGLSEKLISLIPKGIYKISESGIERPDEIKVLKDKGFDGVLIGTSIMSSENPEIFLKELQKYA